MIRKLLFFVLCIWLTANTPSFGQYAAIPEGLTAKILYSDYISPVTGRSVYGDHFFGRVKGVELGYFRNINRFFNVGLPVRVGIATLPVSKTRLDLNDKFVLSGDLVGQFHFFGNGNAIAPYLNGGLGLNYEPENKDLNLQVPVALGVNVRLVSNIYLQLQSEYRYSLEANRNNWAHTAGLLLMFGKEIPPDADKDGIPDKDDDCPTTPGLASLKGCPDKDGDGIADKDDDCPDVAGVAALKGCPDKDGDGIADKDDDCPDVAGIAQFKGCPDTDSDGIPDKDDKCPDKAGVAKFQGCPDTDGDDVQDKEDDCPTVKGLAKFKGCPDTDGDDVPDKDDACPTVKGLAKFKGCPDTDGDGVPDKDDKCPTVAGPVSNFGCPEIKKEDKEVLKFAMQAVQFETGKATLKKSSYAVLDKVLEVLNKYPDYSVAINGHTDNVGGPDRNKKLSEDRAKACYDYLLSKGVKATRMSHAGFGETQPVADNKTAAGRTQNRRTEFNVFLK